MKREPRSEPSASEVETETGDQPAIGLVADADPWVLENVVEAQERGFDVLLLDPRDSGSTVVRVAAKLGADVFSPPAKEVPDADFAQYLRLRANAKTDRGVIVAMDSARPIDFEQSIAAHRDGGEVTDAVTVAQGDSVGVLVGVPAYNEEGAIQDVVAEAQEYADEVLVVDDASQDATAQVARESGATVVEHTENRGYGGALKSVFEEADARNATHLVILDGDGQHDPSDIPKAVQTQKSTAADIVIGSRFAADSETDLPLYRRFGLFVVNTLTNLSMGVVRRDSWTRDTQSGFRTYNRSAIETLSQDDSIGDGMSASTDILFHAHEHGYDLEEIGTTIDYDVEDPSSHNPVSHGLTLVSNILKTIERERPMTTLGLPGFASAFVGIGFGYWTFSNFITSGTFPIGLAVTSVFFVLAGIFACFTAIILHSLKTHFTDHD